MVRHPSEAHPPARATLRATRLESDYSSISILGPLERASSHNEEVVEYGRHVIDVREGVEVVLPAQ